MNNYKISSLTLAFIVICLINSTLLGIIFPYLINEAKTSLQFCLGLGFLIGLFLIFIYLKVFSFMPDKNIIDKINAIFPKFLAKVINFIISLLLFFSVIIIFWRISTFISSEYLNETPHYIIGLVLAIPIFYASFKNVDTLGRCATIIIFSVTALILFNCLSLSSTIELGNFKPLINNDIMHISKGAVIYSVIHLIPLYFSLLIPKDNIIDKEKVSRTIIISYIFSFIFMATIFIIIVGTLGFEVASLYTYPSYAVLKNVNVLNFIKNIENLSVIIWFMFMSFTCTFNLVFIKTSILNIFKINSNKIINIIMISIFMIFMLAIILLLPLENYINKYKNIYIYAPFFVYSALFVIILISLLIGKITHRKKESYSSNELEPSE